MMVPVVATRRSPVSTTAMPVPVRMPARLRRRGLVVALLGPDGCGKTTLAVALAHDPSLRARRIYMGTNRRAGDTLAVGGWLARRRARAASARRGAALGRALLGVLVLVSRLAEEWYRHALAWRQLARGGVVVFDRYALDVGVNERLGRTTLSPVRRLRRRLLRLGAPALDLVIVLDAPGAVLHARKGEHSPERLERMRAAYAELAATRRDVVIVDASRPAADVRTEVAALLRSCLRRTA